MENLDSYGERLANEIKTRFKLTNEAAEQMAKDIDKAIADGIKLDHWLRLPPEKRKEQKKVFKKSTKDRYSSDRFGNKTIPEVVELAQLRKELKGIIKDDFPGRTYSNGTQIKMNRLKELEFKFQNS
jgi:hypothetical protein